MAKLAMAGLGSAFGSIFNIGGSATPAAVPVESQSGGLFTRPTLSWIGEGKNAEAVVPLPDNRSIPVTLKGGGTQAPPVHFHFNIQTIDATSFEGWLVRSKDTLKNLSLQAVATDPQYRASYRGI